jgi:hypothetical protein
VPFYINIIFVLIGMILNVIALSKYLPLFKFRHFLNEVFWVILLIVILSSFSTFFVTNLFDVGLLKLFVSIGTSCVLTALLTYFIATDKLTKVKIHTLIKEKLWIKIQKS